MKESDMRRRTSRILLLALLGLSQLAGVDRVGLAQSACARNSAPTHLTLPYAIDLALKQNRDLKLAKLAVTDSEYKKEIARSAYFPQIKNESTVLHLTELEGVEFPAGAFGVYPGTGPVPGQKLVIDQGGLTAYTSGTGLTQPVTQVFKIRESNRAATADINTAKIQVSQAENEIALKVRQLYYGILIAQLKQEAAAEEVNSSQVKADESASEVERGRALDVVALESRASLLDAKQSALTEKLRVHDLTITFEDLLGLPLNTTLELEANPSAVSISVPSREECVRMARENNPEVRAAEQAVVKAKAGLAAAKYAYIPDVTGLARYSYQSGVPFLVHNFGTFGVLFSYDLFDGGKREAEIHDSQTLLAQAQLNLERIEESVSVQVEAAYDKIEQLQDLVGVADEALKVRTEAARLSDAQFAQNAALPSARAEAHAKVISAKASSLEASLGLSLAQGDLIRTIGEMPR
jgi:outer membrane protein TolC